MKIDGRIIATVLFENLKQQVVELRKKNIIPGLTIILIGNDPASESYVRQKVQKGELIGARVTVKRFSQTVSEQEVFTTIEQLNNDNNVHGIIVQRPIPNHISGSKLNDKTKPEKDIDAFRSDSPYIMPLAAAVLKILEVVFTRLNLDEGLTLTNWLKSKHIVVVGKGQTGGGPTIALLEKMGIPVHVIDSKTKHSEKIKKQADIIISAVGREKTVRALDLKKGVILIGVGIHKAEDSNLHGDYDEEEVKDIAGYYTPIPGGVGPVNVAMLLKNLIDAATSS